MCHFSDIYSIAFNWNDKISQHPVHNEMHFTVFIRIEAPSRIEVPPCFSKEIFKKIPTSHLLTVTFVTCFQYFVGIFLGDRNVSMFNVLFMCRIIITVCSANSVLVFWIFLKETPPQNLVLTPGTSIWINTVYILFWQYCNVYEIKLKTT